RVRRRGTAAPCWASHVVGLRSPPLTPATWRLSRLHGEQPVAAPQGDAPPSDPIPPRNGTGLPRRPSSHTHAAPVGPTASRRRPSGLNAKFAPDTAPGKRVSPCP